MIDPAAYREHLEAMPWNVNDFPELTHLGETIQAIMDDPSPWGSMIRDCALLALTDADDDAS